MGSLFDENPKETAMIKRNEKLIALDNGDSNEVQIFKLKMQIEKLQTEKFAREAMELHGKNRYKIFEMCKTITNEDRWSEFEHIVAEVKIDDSNPMIGVKPQVYRKVMEILDGSYSIRTRAHVETKSISAQRIMKLSGRSKK